MQGLRLSIALVAVLLLPSVTAASSNEWNSPDLLSDYDGSVEPFELQVDGALFIKLHFSDFHLPAGVIVEVSNPDRSDTWRYSTALKDAHTLNAQLNDDGQRRFTAMSVSGDTAIVRVLGNHRLINPGQHRLKIDSWVEGFAGSQNGSVKAPKGINLDTPLSTCGSNQRDDAICWEDERPAEYGRTYPVAMLVTSKGEQCTAWRVGSGNHLLTAEHCLSSQDDLSGAEIWFNYRATACGSSKKASVVKVGGGDLLDTDRTLDYALFTVADFSAIDYFGYLGLDKRTSLSGEHIFIPQHGLGMPMQLAIESDMNDDGWCQVDDLDHDGYGAGTDIGYYCDTTTSSSGSPVLSAETGKVIALHHLGGCVNSGAKISKIWPEISSHFGGSLPQADSSWTVAEPEPGPDPEPEPEPEPEPNEFPTARMKVSCDGLTCEFDGLSSDDEDGEIVEYLWNFGDGNSFEGATAEYEYDESGSYMVSLTVKDNEGASDDRVKTIRPEKPNEAPIASFSASCSFADCAFDGSGSTDPDGSITKWAWKLGDGRTSSEQALTHNYDDAGSYRVELTVTDDAGESDSYGYTVTVNLPNEAPEARFSVTCNDLSCDFSAAGSRDPDGELVSWAWQFGDGNSSDSFSPMHEYSEAGDYLVSLDVTDDEGASDRYELFLSVTAPEAPEPPPEEDDVVTEPSNQKPNAAFTYECDYLSCRLDASDSSDPDGSIESYRWDFDDGNYATGPVVEHAFQDAGRYTIRLTVKDDDGTVDNHWHSLRVEAPEPELLANFDYQCSGQTCVLDAGASQSSDAPIARYDWDFGDGNTGEGQSVEHQYAAGGTYTVTLKITNAASKTGVSSREVVIDEPQPIILKVRQNTLGKQAPATLYWVNARSDFVDIKRDGITIAKVSNNGVYVDSTMKSYRKQGAYQVCESGTQNCSASAKQLQRR